MIANETSGNGFRGVAEYVTFEKDTVASNESFFQLVEPIDGTNGRPFELPRISNHQSRFAGIGARTTAKPTDSLSGLSGRRLVPLKDQPQLFLSGDARTDVELGRTDVANGLRRPTAGQAGAGRARLGDREVRGEYIGGTLIGSPREMSRQAAPFRSARAAKAPVMHYSLALEAGDGRKSKEEWAAMVESFLDKMGFDHKRGAWASWIHRDTNFDHAHIVFLRSMGDGSLWNREFSARRAIQATAEIEREFGLLTHDRTPRKVKRRLTRKEAELASKLATKGQKMTKVEMQKHIDSIVSQLSKDHPGGYDVDQLSSALSAVGVQVEAYEPKGKLTGLKYQMDGVWVNGSSLGTDYSPKGLMARGLLAARQVRSDALVQAPAKQVTSTKEALGDLLGDLDASFQARLAKEDASAIENEHRVSVVKKQKSLAALLIDLPKVAQAALGNFINMLMKLIEKVFLLPEGSLGRIEVPEISNTVDVPIGVVPPAPLRADADQSEARRRAAALKLADGALGRVIKAVEQREPELLPLPVSADEGMKASRFAAVQGLKVSNLEAEAPAPAHAIEASADTPEQAKARELLRRSNIFLLKDKITYLAYGGDDEGARRLERDLDELGFDEKDEQAYQAWTQSAGAKLLDGESSEHYVLRHEAEHLGYRLQLDREFGLGLSDREKTEEALARIQIELVKAELHQEREGREQQR